MGYARAAKWKRALAKARGEAKPYKAPPKLVEAGVIHHADGPELIIPLRTSAQDNDLAWQRAGEQDKKEQAFIVQMLSSYLRGLDRAAIKKVIFTRISCYELDAHDNLRWAMKHVVDIVSWWICEGNADIPWARIGRYDGILSERGMTWAYRQRQHDVKNRKMTQGLSIKFVTRTPERCARWPIWPTFSRAVASTRMRKPRKRTPSSSESTRS